MVAEVRAHNKTLNGFRILAGCEVDIKGDGTLDFPDGILRELDLVLVSVHSRFKMSRGEMTARIVRAVQHPLVHVLGHPTGRLIGSREPYAVDMEKVMDEAKKFGVALELNSYPDRLDLNDVHLKLAKERGVPIVISTDSHSTLHLDNLVFGIHTARRGWIEKKDVINTRPLKELMKFLKKAKAK